MNTASALLPRTRVPVTLHRLVRVRAANTGAGATTMALALADAADAGGLRTHLVDAAAPIWSGLGGASAVELGAAHGWRRGRRGSGTLIDRVEQYVPGPDHVPPPRVVARSDLTVIDTGWTSRELGGSSGWVVSGRTDAEIVVTTAGPLALSQTEAVLTSLDEAGVLDRVIVVVTRAPRRSSHLYAVAGPRLRALNARRAVHIAPRRGIECEIGPEPSPQPLLALGRSLLRVVAVGAPGVHPDMEGSLPR